MALGVANEGAQADRILVGRNPLAKFEPIAEPGEHAVVITKDGKIDKNAVK